MTLNFMLGWVRTILPRENEAPIGVPRTSKWSVQTLMRRNKHTHTLIKMIWFKRRISLLNLSPSFHFRKYCPWNIFGAFRSRYQCLTEPIFTRKAWNSALCTFYISHNVPLYFAKLSLGWKSNFSCSWTETSSIITISPPSHPATHPSSHPTGQV